MYYKINNNKQDVISEYNQRKLNQSIKCESLVIVLNKEVSKIYSNGNQKKRCGISTCHAFLSGDILLKDVALVGKFDRIIYDVNQAKFIRESGLDLMQGDCVIFFPKLKRCYVVS